MLKIITIIILCITSLVAMPVSQYNRPVLTKQGVFSATFPFRLNIYNSSSSLTLGGLSMIPSYGLFQNFHTKLGLFNSLRVYPYNQKESLDDDIDIVVNFGLRSDSDREYFQITSSDFKSLGVIAKFSNFKMFFQEIEMTSSSSFGGAREEEYRILLALQATEKLDFGFESKYVDRKKVGNLELDYTQNTLVVGHNRTSYSRGEWKLFTRGYVLHEYKASYGVEYRLHFIW